jgi:hypothetical protein
LKPNPRGAATNNHPDLIANGTATWCFAETIEARGLGTEQQVPVDAGRGLRNTAGNQESGQILNEAQLGFAEYLADALARLLVIGGARSTIAADTQVMIAATTEAVQRVVSAPEGATWLVEPGGLDA